MMMPTIVHVTMLQLFIGWFAQRNNLYTEMQLSTRQWMIEIEPHSLIFNVIHACIASVPFVIAHR